MSCLGILGVIFKNHYVGSLWFVCLTERMWPYGQTPPLEKCEQPDLKHPRAMLQNDICPQNSPRGGGGFRLLAHGLSVRLARSQKKQITPNSLRWPRAIHQEKKKQPKIRQVKGSCPSPTKMLKGLSKRKPTKTLKERCTAM